MGQDTDDLQATADLGETDKSWEQVQGVRNTLGSESSKSQKKTLSQSAGKGLIKVVLKQIMV